MFTFTFSCKQFGSAHRDVVQDTLELTPEVRKGVEAHGTHAVRVYRDSEDLPLYLGGSSVSSLEAFIQRYNAANGVKVEPEAFDIEELLLAAKQHGEDSGEPDHEVGDLQECLRAAVALFDRKQFERFYQSDAVIATLELGGIIETK